METLSQELVSSIEKAINMSGGLFQAHPKHPDYKTTRPGAEPGEVACFKRDVEDERSDYISVITHSAGETDEDGYTWSTDCYEISISRGDGSQHRNLAETSTKAAELVAKEMTN